MYIILADNQDITRAGLMYVCGLIAGSVCCTVEDKSAMIDQLKNHPDAMVILDYTLFDINDVEELDILHGRFPIAHWVMFSVDLTEDFVRRVIAIGNRFSILLKESPLAEIRDCISFAMRGQRYICQRTAEILLAPAATKQDEEVKLTPTEIEILKDISLGMTTKEIAEKRFSSFHTVNTHRKNIFRKLGVNNIHEATKYALRSGLIDSAEYYI